MIQFEDEIEKEKEETKVSKEKLDKNLVIYVERINCALKQKNYQELLHVFQQTEVMELVHLDNTLAMFAIVLSIYQMEIEELGVSKVLENIFSLNDAEDYYLNIKFLMWRLEFYHEKAEIAEYIKNHNISLQFLKYLIHTSSFSKADTAFQIAMLLKQMGQVGKAFGMLNYVDELSPNEEIVYCEMADICMQNRQYQAAVECLKRIQNPTSLLQQYEQKWEKAGQLG